MQLSENDYSRMREERIDCFKMYLDDTWEKYKDNFNHIINIFNWENVILDKTNS